MAEALGLAAGIVGLVSLSIQLLEVARKFQDDAITCKKDVGDLIQELTALHRVLELLRDGWKEKALPPNFDRSALAGIEQICEEHLSSLLEKLNKAAGWMQRKTVFNLKGATFRLKWPLEAKRTREITYSIHRYFAIFSWLLHHHESEMLLKLSADADKLLEKQEELITQSRSVFEKLNATLAPFHAASVITNGALTAVRKEENSEDGVKTLMVDAKSAEEIRILENARIHSDEKARRLHAEIIENYKEAQRKEFLDKIPTIHSNNKQRSVLAAHEPGTGSWFLAHPRYESWKTSDRPSTILCQGAPGSGKTILTSVAIENVIKMSPNDTIQVAYLYCDYRNQSTTSVSRLLQTLLRQLLTPERLIFPFVRDKCLKLFEKPDQSAAAAVSLIQILAKSSSQTFLFVDALDEVALLDKTTGRDVRPKFLEALSSLRDCCHIFLTTRPHIDMHSFSNLPASQKIHISASDEDLSAFVTSSIAASTTLSTFTKQDATLKDRIIKTVQEKSQQMFLLARFHVSRIAVATSPREVRDLLESLSCSLTDVYGFFLERLRCQPPNKWNLARRALCWVSKTKRPLTASELVHALSFKPGDSGIGSSEAIDISMIIEVCDGLLQLEPVSQGSYSSSFIVGFSHATIAEFMQQLRTPFDVHYDIATTSLGYLLMHKRATETRNPNTRIEYPFLSYATRFWVVHTSRSRRKLPADLLLQWARISPSPLAVLIPYGIEYAIRCLLKYGFSANSYCNGVSPLMLAAHYRLPRCVSILLRAGANVNYVGDATNPYNTALSRASIRGDSKTALLLIRAGANPDIGAIPPIICAIKANQPVILQQIIDAGCNIGIKYANKTPLYIALECNNPDMADLLVQAGADVNITSTTSKITPLQLAVYGKLWDTAVIILQSGADPMKQTRVGLSPLQHAAYEGNTKLVHVLLQVCGKALRENPLGEREKCLAGLIHGGIATLQENDGSVSFAVDRQEAAHSSKSPLHLALEGRHYGVAKLLIEAEIGINEISGNPPYSPLEWAVAQDEPSLVTQLLAAGADPNLFGTCIPLLSAASRYPRVENHLETRSTAVIAQLLDAGASPHASQGRFKDNIKSCIKVNIENKWWGADDPAIVRLRTAVSLPEEWNAL